MLRTTPKIAYDRKASYQFCIRMQFKPLANVSRDYIIARGFNPDSLKRVRSSMVGEQKWVGTTGQSWRDYLEELEATFAPINNRLLDALKVKEGGRIADIGCGGGGLTRHLAASLGEGSTAIGFDISPDLIEAARGHPSSTAIDYICANAETYVPSGELFDRLTSRFGIMFFENEQAAFTNLKSWLKPGGRFAFAVWGSYDDNPWQGVIRDVVKNYIDVPEIQPGQPSLYDTKTQMFSPLF